MSLTIGSTILKTSGITSFAVTSLGYNLSDGNGNGVLTNTGDQINTDPLLGPLQNNGGPCFTHALLPGSPAIDAGKNFSGSTTDQRGTGFTRTVDLGFPKPTGGDGTDIGSFELQPQPSPTPTPTATYTPTPTATATATFTPTATATATATATVTATATATATATFSPTATATATFTPTATATATATATPTATATATVTPPPTPTPTAAPTPAAPHALKATNITASSFTANWSSVAGASGYRLDVSTSSSFKTYVPGYQNLNVGNTTSYNVTGLSQNTTYRYRLRSYNGNGTSPNSNVVSAVTKNH